MSSYSAQLREEQQAVSRAYDRLDALRAQARSRLDTVRAAGSHGSPTQRTERDSFATMYEDRLTQLRAVEDRLVFGRLDDVHGAHRYIGRIGLSDEDHEPILTDWRADAARPFYEATPSNHGDIVMRRHITLSFREVVGVEDEVLDVHSDQVGEASSNGTLTGEGALLASLNAKRTGKMTDIVETLQKDCEALENETLFASADRYMALIYPEFTTAASYLPQEAIVAFCDHGNLQRGEKDRAEEFGLLLDSFLTSGTLFGELCDYYATMDDLAASLRGRAVIYCDT